MTTRAIEARRAALMVEAWNLLRRQQPSEWERDRGEVDRVRIARAVVLRVIRDLVSDRAAAWPEVRPYSEIELLILSGALTAERARPRWWRLW